MKLILWRGIPLLLYYKPDFKCAHFRDLYSRCTRKYYSLFCSAVFVYVCVYSFLSDTFLLLKSLHTEYNIFACVFPCFSYSPSLSYQKCMLQMRKRRKSNLVRFFLWTKVSEAVCKHDWQNVRSYLFFYVWKFRTQCAMTLTFTWVNIYIRIFTWVQFLGTLPISGRTKPDQISFFTQRIMKDLRYTNLHIDLQTNMGLQGQDERPLFVHWTHLTYILYEVRGGRTVQYGGECHMEWGPPTAQRTPAWREDMHKTLPASIAVSKRDLLG